MPKQGEINYIKMLGQDDFTHAFNMPFSDPLAGRYLMQIGFVLLLLPPPPAKLIDIGCGTGWSSCFFAKAGYDVVGVDISADMRDLANKNKKKYGIENVDFLVKDYETLKLSEKFDCAVFLNSLHHAEDEHKVIARVYDLLKDGGICVTSEPGVGHSDTEAAITAVRRFNVTEKEMPPKHIIKIARQCGFRKYDVFPHADSIAYYSMYSVINSPANLRNIKMLKKLVKLIWTFLQKRNSGVVTLYK